MTAKGADIRHDIRSDITIRNDLDIYRNIRLRGDNTMRTKNMLKSMIISAALISAGIAAAFIPVSRVEARNIYAFVQGTVCKGSTDDTLKLYSLSSGNYEIKIDKNTDKSKCSSLAAGKAVTVAIYKGSDNKYYADTIVSGKVDTLVTTNINDTSTTTAATTNTSSTESSSVPSNTIEVTGTPTDKSTGSVLYLDTKDGVMYLVVDSSTDTSGGFMFTPGNKVTAYVYRGSDANMHVAKVTGKRSSGATVGGNTTSFTGTVESKSTEETLYLNTSGGVMTFKLDSSTTLSGTKGITKGKTVTISGAVGSDETWHAVSISVK